MIDFKILCNNMLDVLEVFQTSSSLNQFIITLGLVLSTTIL